jgi:uncharacterized RDD family membrane protein YckC
MEGPEITIHIYPVASRGKRFLNHILDGLAVSLILSLLGAVAGFFVADLPGFLLAYKGLPVFLIVGAVYFYYFAVTEATTSRTFGKFLTRTVVLNHRNARPSLKQILIRSAARLIPCEPVSFLIGSRTSGWHDELSDTKIVDISKPPEVLKKAVDVRPVAPYATRNPRAHP